MKMATLFHNTDFKTNLINLTETKKMKNNYHKELNCKSVVHKLKKTQKISLITVIKATEQKEI